MTGPIEHERTKAPGRPSLSQSSPLHNWLTPPTSFSEEPSSSLATSVPSRAPGLGPERQGSGDSYKSKSSPAQLPGLQTHLAEIPAGLAPSRLAKGSVEQLVAAAAWGRRVIRGGAVSGPSVAALTLGELQQGLTLSVSKLRASLVSLIWRIGSRI